MPHGSRLSRPFTFSNANERRRFIAVEPPERMVSAPQDARRRNELAVHRLKCGTAEIGREAIKDAFMAWTAPVLIEICIGLEINGYLPPEF